MNQHHDEEAKDGGQEEDGGGSKRSGKQSRQGGNKGNHGTDRAQIRKAVGRNLKPEERWSIKDAIHKVKGGAEDNNNISEELGGLKDAVKDGLKAVPKWSRPRIPPRG